MSLGRTERIRRIAEALGVAAVVVGLLLVAYQIRQANRIAQGTTTYEIVRDINQFNEMGASNAAFAGLLVALSDEQAELSEVQSRQAQLLAYRFLNIWITQQTEYNNGLLTENHLAIAKADVLSVLADYPRLRPYFAVAMQAQPAFSGYEVLQPLLK
jgi:hypothetical protein